MQLHRALTPIFLALLAGCSLADIRPAELKREGVSEASAARGRVLLEAMQAAHGGREQWTASAYTVAVVQDDWPGSVSRALFSPWPDRNYPMRLTFENGADNSRADFFAGEWEGRVWGIQNWATYTKENPNAEPVFEQDDTIKFWLPTMQYFIEAPFRLPEAPIVADAGQTVFRGETYDRVYVTWISEEPQDSVDQYLLFLDPESHMLVWLEYTVRDFGGFVTGLMHYEDYQNVGGLQVPTRLTVVEDHESDAVLHQMTLSELELRPGLNRAFVVPKPDIRRAKHD